MGHKDDQKYREDVGGKGKQGITNRPNDDGAGNSNPDGRHENDRGGVDAQGPKLDPGTQQSGNTGSNRRVGR